MMYIYLQQQLYSSGAYNSEHRQVGPRELGQDNWAPTIEPRQLGLGN